MILVATLLGYFCLVGLTTRRFGARTRWLLLAGIFALVMFDFASRSIW
jgi:hypothetical protein